MTTSTITAMRKGDPQHMLREKLQTTEDRGLPGQKQLETVEDRRRPGQEPLQTKIHRFSLLQIATCTHLS